MEDETLDLFVTHTISIVLSPPFASLPFLIAHLPLRTLRTRKGFVRFLSCTLAFM